MTATKTLTELEILELASFAINTKIRKYLDKKAADPECAEIYDSIIEKYDNQLEQLDARIEALEEDQENE